MLALKCVVILLLLTTTGACRRRHGCKCQKCPPIAKQCPQDEIWEAAKGQTGVQVSWRSATAKDCKGRNIPSSDIWSWPKSSGNRFKEGVHNINIYAKDRYNNEKGICSFKITVKVTRCDTTTRPSNGDVCCDHDNIYGSSCHFSCNRGYDLIGDPTSYCQKDGSWTNSPPICQAISCPSLSSIANGAITCTNNDVLPWSHDFSGDTSPMHYGSKCTYSCNDGYNISHGHKIRECLSSKEWSGIKPICLDKTLPSIACPPRLIAYADAQKNSTLVSWNPPTATDNSGLTVKIQHISGPIPGYDIEAGVHTVSYNAIDSSGNEKSCSFSVVVNQIRCSELIDTKIQRVDCPSGFVYGASCALSCAPGYFLGGINKMTCQRYGNSPTGVWDVNRPSCEQIHCPVLSPPKNGNIKEGSCSTVYGSWCSFDCHPGFILTGNSSRHCLSRDGDRVGYWDGVEVTCEVITCQRPHIPPHGKISSDSSRECSVNQNVPQGTVCNYECEQGFFILGTTSLTCAEYGWSGIPPSCQVLTCDTKAIAIPQNGYRSGCSTETVPYLSTCILGCNVGYMPTTPSTVTCEVDSNVENAGKWQGNIITVCNPVTCIPYDPPDNGNITGCNHEGTSTSKKRPQPWNAVCSAQCDDGYTPFGPQIRNCMQSGIWDGNPLECKDVTMPSVICPDPMVLFAEPRRQFVVTDFPWEPLQVDDVSQPVKVTLEAVNGNSYSEDFNSTTVLPEGAYSLHYVVTDGAGNNATCTVDLTIRVIRCPPLFPPNNGDAALVGGQGPCSGNPALGSVCRITCKNGYHLTDGTDASERECIPNGTYSTLGDWNGVHQECEPVKCKVHKISNGYVHGCSGDSVTYQTSCLFSCLVGFEGANGTSFVHMKCKADGNWTGSPITCSPVECPGRFELQHGSITPEKCSGNTSLQYSDVCWFTCNEGFRLDGPPAKTCSAMGMWDRQRNTVCIDEQSPRFNTTCPSYVQLFAESGSTKALLHYDEPFTTDNAGDEGVTFTRHSALTIGDLVSEGPHIITYTSIDEAGNQAKCDFHINVRVHRCNSLEAPTSGSVICPKQILGATCQFNCNEGYKLQGPVNVTCLLHNSTPTWNGAIPTCQPVMCPALPNRLPAYKAGCGGLSERYGTTCVWSCPYGYQGTGSSVSICQSDGSWTESNFTCTEQACPDIVLLDEVEFTPPGCNTNSSYNDICYLSCSNSGYRIHPLTMESLLCRGDGKWSQDTTNITCRDYQAPSFEDCPMDFIVYTEKESLQAHVSWNISAEDNSEEQINVICDRDVMLYPIGHYYTQCSATDTVGNTATCRFTFSVKARKCQQLTPPMHASFVGLCSSHHGSICSIQCNEGYRLQGSSQASCERDEVTNEMFWAREELPHCKTSSCPSIPANIVPANGGVHPVYCTEVTNPVHGTVCTFYCKYSFTLTGYTHPISCQSDGTWNISLNTITVNCEDKVNPTIITCPDNQILTLADGIVETEAYFDVPSASDNSGGLLVIKKSPADVRSPYTVNKTILVTYEFFDQSNNSARCTFQISVESQLFPTVEFCPNNMTFTATGIRTFVNWTQPVFSEPSGNHESLLVNCNVSPGNEMYLGVHNIICMATNQENGKTSECKFVVSVVAATCPPLPWPRNGAFACGIWALGQFCRQLCDEKYDVPPGNYDPFFICGSTGMWSHSKVLHCSFRREPNTFNLPSELHYFSGNCSDPATRKAIQDAFIILISNHTEFAEVCEASLGCRAENVEVTCSAGRRKRFLARPGRSNRQRQYANHKEYLQNKRPEEFMKKNKYSNYNYGKYEESVLIRAKRKVGNFRQRRSNEDKVITISFQIVVTLPGNVTDAEYESTAYSAIDNLYKIVDVLEEEAGEGSLVPEVENVSLSVYQDQPLSYGYPGPKCEEGLAISWESLTCVPCVPGTYFNAADAQCTLCPIGTYQDREMQTSCLQCLNGTTTLEEGATNSTECLALCKAGSYSLNGVEPCSLCELGLYQPQEGESRCIKCRLHYSTLTMGSTSEEQCLAFCSPGYYSSTGFEPCQPCPVRYYQSYTGQQSCDLCPGIKTTVGVGTVNETQCNVTAECVPNECVNGATCLPLTQGPMCLCADGFNGTYCEENIEDCTDYSCINGGSCIDGKNSHSCICPTGFEGPDCSIDIDECAVQPCRNASVCIDLRGDFMCECPEGYTGKRCDHIIDPCENDPCQSEGICLKLRTTFFCICPSGKTGEICEIDIDECQSLPCLNGGTCLDLWDSYECVCALGYDGYNCEIDEDLCEPNPCANGATCVDETDMYICVCPPGKAGDLCERDITSCDKKPCLRGQCNLLSQTVDGVKLDFTCDCSLTGYTGIHCEVEVEDCLSNPCSNGGICKKTTNGHLCECQPQFTGKTCEQISSPCDKMVCENNGTCISDDLSAVCVCPVEYEGTYCETVRTSCQHGFCQNGGYCAPSGNSQFCVCMEGFNGIACEKNINECRSEPCENNGVCIDAVNEYTCDCQPGYSGENCEINIDECLSGPCLNGTCIDQINDFVCYCFDGFEGKLCDIDTNDCVQHNCINGQCIDGNETYTCECYKGFEGQLCEAEIDECASNPCIHSIECKDQRNNYECVCEDGWTGLDCEVSLDDCDNIVCENGGTCQDKHMSFTCLCLPGFEGALCEENVNECASSPCLAGLCVDEVNGYTCNCPYGREGKQCQIHTSVCLSNPCYNGATCVVDEDEDIYNCSCIDGFTGKHCETNENDCENNDCPENATCVDKINDFSCICPPGFDGDNCDKAMDPCQAFPCENGGTCVVGDDFKRSCLCTLGYDGIYCERNIDDCQPNPCLHNGACVDGLNEFTCQCETGYRGVICDEDIDFCLENGCYAMGTKKCHDGIDGYTCECRHGFFGQYCEKVSSINYDMVFSAFDANQFAVVRGVPQEDVHSFTMIFWLRTTSDDSPILMHGLKSNDERLMPSLIVEYPQRLTIYIQGNHLKTGVSVNDDTWHNIGLSFDNTTSRIQVFVDSSLVHTQIVPATSNVIPKSGDFILGSYMDTALDERYKEHFAGKISGLNLWDEVMDSNTMMEYTKTCFSHVPGSVITMNDFLDGILGDISFEEPSTCDPINDCANSTCDNGGYCIDGYHESTCVCPKGLGGPACRVNFDDCLVNACENNGTCVDGFQTFTCECTKGFTGPDCALEVVDGGWSDWSPWTECSKSCGTGGTQMRTRGCYNPEPDNGGADCGTDDSETRDCNIKSCPVCKKFVSPKNGYSRCETNFTGDTSCSIYCYQGFAFSIPPRDEYQCGESTNYLWTHESILNPLLKVPSCTQITKPLGFKVQVRTVYKDLQCSSLEDPEVREVNNNIVQTASVVSQQEGCAETKDCQLVELSTSGCDPHVTKRDVTGRRDRRSTTSNVTVSMTFYQAINVSGSNFTSSNDVMRQDSAEKAAFNLRSLIAKIKNLVKDGSYLISAEGQLYDAEYAEEIEGYQCAEGQIYRDNETMCLPCAAGTFKTENACEPCGEGFFQPEEGQTSCLLCPEGAKSSMLGAVSVEECDPGNIFEPEHPDD